MVKTITLVLILLCAMSCGVPFKDYESYRSAPDKERMEAVMHYLKKSDLDCVPPFIVGVIDHSLTDPSDGAILAELIPRHDFHRFMQSAVPTAYYSLTPSYYGSRPPQLASLVDSFIVRRTMASFEDMDSCTRRLRTMIRQDLNSGRFPFPVKDADLALPFDSAKTRSESHSFMSNIYIMDLVSNKYTFGEFLTLPRNVQTRLLGITLLYLGLNSGNSTVDELIEIADLFKTEWADNASYYLTRTEVAAVGRGENMAYFVRTYVNTVISRF